MSTPVVHSDPELPAMARQASDLHHRRGLSHPACATASPIEALGGWISVARVRSPRHKTSQFDRPGRSDLHLFAFVERVDILRTTPDPAPSGFTLAQQLVMTFPRWMIGLLPRSSRPVTPESNQKLKKDTYKLSLASADYGYVFCACLGFPWVIWRA